MRVLIIGAGAVGIEAALAASARGFDVKLIEADALPGGAVRERQHLSLLAPWAAATSAAGRELVDLDADDLDECPTGEAWLDDYLEPLTAALQERHDLRFESAALAIGRGLASLGGQDSPSGDFFVYGATEESEFILQADVIIDASGRSEVQSFLGPGGIPAMGEADLGHLFFHGIPDLEGGDEFQFAGATTLVVGDGHSALSTLEILVELSERERKTRILWLGTDATPTFEGPSSYPEEQRLQAFGRQLLANPGRVERLVPGTILSVALTDNERLELDLRGTDGKAQKLVVDQLVNNTGGRPSLALTAAIQTNFEWPSLGIPLRSGDVRQRLSHPTPGYFAVGARAHGARPGFDIQQGIREVMELIASL